MRTRDTVQKAEEFIEGEYEKGTEFCNYGLALSTFALHKTVASRNSTTRDRLVADLQRRITTSKMCKLINQKPRKNNTSFLHTVKMMCCFNQFLL